MNFTFRLDKIKDSNELRDAIMNHLKQGDLVYMYWQDDLLGVFVSSDDVHDIICMTVAERLSKNPSVISDLHDRLSDESPKPFNI
jgi:hypothetical protein